VLIPQGQREEMDAETGKPVDLVQRGRSQGVEVAEVEDVVAAYGRLTERRLEQPRVALGVPELSGTVEKELEARAKTWLATYREEAAGCERLRGRLGETAAQVGEQLAAAKASAERAEQRLSEGRVAPAYDQAVSATLQASATLDVLKALAALQGGDMRQAARTVALGDDRDEEVRITAAQLADLVVDTPDGC